MVVRLVPQGIVDSERRLNLVVIRSDSVEVKVHGAEPGDVLHDVHASQGVILEVPLGVPIEFLVARDVVVGCEQEPAGSAGRVDNFFACLRLDAVHDGLDQRPWREILTGSALHVLGVLFQESLVGVPLHVRGHRCPGLLADQLDD